MTGMHVAPVTRHTWWRDEAACIRTDPEWFYDDGCLNLALDICAGCPVKTECLADAITHSDYHGVRAEMTGEERYALVKRMQRAKQPSRNRRATA